VSRFRRLPELAIAPHLYGAECRLAMTGQTERIHSGSARIEIWATLTREVEPNQRFSLVKVDSNELAVRRVHEVYESCVALVLRKGTHQKSASRDPRFGTRI
jgi:hypothetical protein